MCVWNVIQMMIVLAMVVSISVITMVMWIVVKILVGKGEEHVKYVSSDPYLAGQLVKVFSEAAGLWIGIVPRISVNQIMGIWLASAI